MNSVKADLLHILLRLYYLARVRMLRSYLERVKKSPICLILLSCTQLCILLRESETSEISGFLLPEREEIASRFLLEFAAAQLIQDADNAFWWSPRLIVVNKLIVGMCGFKNPPSSTGSVEIGYSIVFSQQGRGFATQAVSLLIEEGFSKGEVRIIEAYTVSANTASWRVLEKNEFMKDGSKVDPNDGEVQIWRKFR